MSLKGEVGSGKGTGTSVEVNPNPSCVGVAWSDAPTREYSAGRICSSHFSSTDAALMRDVVTLRDG